MIPDLRIWEFIRVDVGIGNCIMRQDSKKELGLVRRSRKISSQLLAALAVVLIGLVVTLPAVFSGRSSGYNLPIHLKWFQQFSAQFWSGDIYPRWLSGM